MTEENKIPNFMANSMDFKKVVAANFSNTIDTIKDGNIEGVSIDQNTNVMLIMNFGLIEGRLIIKDEETPEKLDSNNFNGFLFKVLNRNIEEFMTEYESKVGTDDLKVVNHTGRLIVADATITPYTNPQASFNMDRILIFTDQIVGITVGAISR